MSDVETLVPPAGNASRGASLGKSFEERRNSLNFLRLVLAGLVLLTHGIALGGFGTDTLMNKTSSGLLAVYGFFGISGYLIAASASRNTVGRYLWMRVLRIFPAFLVCLVLTSFFFGLIGWYHSNPSCGLSCYLRVHKGPIDYILSNSWLHVNQASITGTLRGAPYDRAWNGSLWSLFYEFVCYLVLALLAFTRLLRKKIVLILAATTMTAEFVIGSVPSFSWHFNAFRNIDTYKLLVVVPIFLVGVLVYLYRYNIPDSGVLAIACGAILVIGVLVPLGGHYPGFQLTSTDLFAPAMVYPMLWLGIHLPFQRIGARNDYSYGVYIYGYPVTQLLALWGAYRLGFPAFMALIILMAAPFAAASWWLVERHALRLKRITLRARGARDQADNADARLDVTGTLPAID